MVRFGGKATPARSTNAAKKLRSTPRRGTRVRESVAGAWGISLVLRQRKAPLRLQHLCTPLRARRWHAVKHCQNRGRADKKLAARHALPAATPPSRRFCSPPPFVKCPPAGSTAMTRTPTGERDARRNGFVRQHHILLHSSPSPPIYSTHPHRQDSGQAHPTRHPLGHLPDCPREFGA